MVENEKELDIIDKAHLAAERLERANKIKAELLDREEDLQKRAEGRLLLGGETYAGAPPKKEMTEEEKIQAGLKIQWKGTALEGYFK